MMSIIVLKKCFRIAKRKTNKMERTAQNKEDEKVLIEDLIKLSNVIQTMIKIGRFSNEGISEVYDIYCCFRGIFQDEYHDKIFCHCQRLAHHCDSKKKCADNKIV